MVTHSLSFPTPTHQRENVTFIEILKNSLPLMHTEVTLGCGLRLDLSEMEATFLFVLKTWLIIV